MVDNETQLTEVVFKIPPEEDLGFPAEWVWAEPLDANTFRLRNQPIYANGYAFCDVVEAEETEDGFQVMRPRDRSGYSAVRIYPPVDEPKTAGVKTALQELGGRTYDSNIPNIFALMVAPEVAFEPLLKWLEAEAERQGEDEFGYEPIFISSHHAREVGKSRSAATPGWIESYF
jgi:hypothetical protein